MAFEVTKIKQIKNWTNELVRVVNLEKKQPYAIAPHSSIGDMSVDIPWMMSNSDFSAQDPHLLLILLSNTNRRTYLWQKDQFIINGRSLADSWLANGGNGVGGDRDLVIAQNGVFLYGLGASPYEPINIQATAENDPYESFNPETEK